MVGCRRIEAVYGHIRPCGPWRNVINYNSINGVEGRGARRIENRRSSRRALRHAEKGAIRRLDG